MSLGEKDKKILKDACNKLQRTLDRDLTYLEKALIITMFEDVYSIEKMNHTIVNVFVTACNIEEAPELADKLANSVKALMIDSIKVAIEEANK